MSRGSYWGYVRKDGVEVIAIRDPLETEPKLGNLADYVLQERDVLFIIGPNKVLDKIKD